MLRKVSHIVLALLLFVTTTGLTFSKHYCHSKLVSVSLFKEAKSCCGPGSCSCCHNESETYRLDEDFPVAPALEIPETASIELIVLALPVYLTSHEQDVPIDDFLIEESPPPPTIQTVLSQRQTYLL